MISAINQTNGTNQYCKNHKEPTKTFSQEFKKQNHKNMKNNTENLIMLKADGIHITNKQKIKL